MRDPRSRSKPPPAPAPGAPPGPGAPPAPPGATPGPEDEPVRPSFEEVYRSAQPYVLRLLWRLGVESRNLEDVAHEVFLVVHRRLPDYQPGGSLNAWLSAIASRVALRHRQLARNVRELLSDDGRAVDVADPGLDVEQLHAQAETGHLVRQLIQHIETSRRPIFILHDLEGMAMRDIAQAFQISQNTAWDRLRRARDEFETAARRLDARDRHALGVRGLRVTLAPLLLPAGPQSLGTGAGGLEASAARLWARIQTSLAPGEVEEPVRGGLGAPPSGPRGAVGGRAMTVPPRHASLVVTVSGTKLAAAGATLFLAGAGAATAAISALGAQPPSPPLEIRRDEIAQRPLAPPIAAPLGAPPAAPTAAMPAPTTAMPAPTTAMPAPTAAMPAPTTAMPAPATAMSAPATTARASTSAARSAAHVADRHSAGPDISLLGRADAALGAGRATEALDLLERHARKYPHGPSTEQREALAVRVLLAAGRRPEAAARAERFRAAFPGSLLMPAVDAVLEPP
ncbi:RNA polymerase sigma factor [Sorangium sp. So ce1151]|uniref:RNA polymerase sigma factor n=1 Tax=Sorangium sp. So ce1151 TaxID=3133332 RepID=UPI003F5F1CAD